MLHGTRDLEIKYPGNSIPEKQGYRIHDPADHVMVGDLSRDGPGPGPLVTLGNPGKFPGDSPIGAGVRVHDDADYEGGDSRWVCDCGTLGR